MEYIDLKTKGMKYSNPVVIEREQLQILVNHFYSAIELCEALGIHKYSKDENKMLQMKTYVDEHFGSDLKKLFEDEKSKD